MSIRVSLTSISVADQDVGLAFYRDKLGFVVKHDIDMGGGARWLTLVPADDPTGAELLLEPNAGYAAMGALKAALVADGIPFTQLDVDDLEAEYSRLTAAGVALHRPGTRHGPGQNGDLR